MTGSRLASLQTLPWLRRGVPWLGGLFIAAIVAMAAYDIVRSYEVAVAETGRELDTQARVIAEQTTRTFQAVDVVLRHLAQLYEQGRLASLGAYELHKYLREQQIGLVQIEGLIVVDAEGTILATSLYFPSPGTVSNIADGRTFDALRDAAGRRDLMVGSASESRLDGQWLFPMARRIETADGKFAGAVGARGRIDYFQDFYRDIQLDPDTKTSLMHRNGTLVARYPPAQSALGKRFDLFDTMLAVGAAAAVRPMRAVSPIDGVERFGAIGEVSGYPLYVLVTRDTEAALAPWRRQAYGTVARTLALAGLAASLLVMLMRQLSRLSAARESLEAATGRFAVAVAGSDDGIWDWDCRRQSVFVSARGREILGLPPGPDVQPADEWPSIIRFHPDDAPKNATAMRDHLEGVTPAYEGEFRVEHRAGDYRWVRFRGVCVRDANGQPLRMAGSVSDVDARKRAEDALRESEERYAIAMTGSNEGHWVWNVVTDEFYASPKLKDLFGIARDIDIPTRAVLMQNLRLHADDVDHLQRTVTAHLEGRSAQLDLEYRIIDPDGNVRWINSRAQCFRSADGKPLRMAGATINVTKRKHAEEALRASEERFHLAVSGSKQGLWDWDLAGDTLFLSPRAQAFMGLPPAEPLRPRREWLALTQFHPDDLGSVRQAISAHLRGTTEHFEVEFRLRHPSGEWRWFRQRGVAVRNAQGRAYRMAGSFEDITDRRGAEEERDRLEGQLRRAQKLEAIGTLAGGIAHDFNNILAAILGYGEMAQKDATPGTPLRRHIDAALKAAMRAKSLVARILAFSRSGISDRVPVHVQSIVVEALDLIAGSLARDIRLERQLAAPDAAVLGDPAQIHQVVMNLCANAAQSMQTGGVLTVSLDGVDMEETTVATSPLRGGRYVRLRVRDTGSGIAPSILERIFDPFFTTRDVGVGTGLGLSLVHGIVTDLGGGIDVQSRVGEGSLFTVYLPWQERADAPDVPEALVAIGAGETILLVDDEEALVQLGEEMIAELGYEPVGCTSSLRALQTFRDDPARFDAVLSDESMADLTGCELAAQIRAIRPDIPVILMSGYVNQALSARAKAAGVIDVLSKPLSSREIAAALAAILRSGASPTRAVR